jgi:hypothetical protein
MTRGIDYISIRYPHRHPRKFVFDTPVLEEYPAGVTFIRGSNAIAGGSSNSRVCIWNISMGEIFQVLDHDGLVPLIISEAWS